MLTAPPAAAEAAPCCPIASAAASVAITVVATCHFSTVRIGLPRTRKGGHGAKAAKYSSTRASSELLQELVEVIEARIMQNKFAAAFPARADFHRGAEPLGDFLLEPREIAVSALASRASRAAQQRLHERFGFAHRQPFRRYALRRFDLTRRVEREQR